MHGNAAYLRDVATPKDTAFIQTNVVRVNGQRQVYIPVYRQLGSSTLAVVNNLKEAVPNMQNRLSRGGIDLKVVMDQSIYVKQSIESLAEEGVLGAVLCSLVILLFLGEWRMTLIAVMTIPVSVLSAMIFLYYTGNTINVMTLAGLALAIGPLVDSAIICLENTHRHLAHGRVALRGGVPGRQRSGHARVGGKLLHAARARSAGHDARHGAVLVQADGDGGRVRHDRGLLALAVVRARSLRRLAEVARRSLRRAMATARTRTAPRRIKAWFAQPRLRPLGRDDRESASAGTSGCWKPS